RGQKVTGAWLAGVAKATRARKDPHLSCDLVEHDWQSTIHAKGFGRKQEAALRERTRERVPVAERRAVAAQQFERLMRHRGPAVKAAAARALAFEVAPGRLG